ncbi:MAG: hydroxysqualene dehydroxylase HpnE [Noviherbaspirillum sp.]
MSKAERRVAVVGAGWAGCAAAVELCSRGQQVTLFEAARTPGGRARRVEIDGRTLDNGQHMLLGAYRESLRLMRMVGIDPRAALLRLPLQMRYPEGSGGMDFVAARLPAPLHVAVALLRARGLAKADKLALARFSTAARWMGWGLNQDCTVAELLERFDQTERLCRLMWRPLCIAALNTPPERASAQVFLAVLRDSLGARRAASDMLLPRVDLSALFPQAAAAFLAQRGATLKLGAAVTQIAAHGAGWRLEAGAHSDQESYDAVIVATDAARAARLVAPHWAGAPFPAFDHEAISTCYLRYGPGTRLPAPMLALPDDPAQGHWGQFVFDRGQLSRDDAGLLAVVISASTDALTLGSDALAAAIAAQLGAVLRDARLSQPQWSRVISEKRATFSCTPGLQRPGNQSGSAGLLVAGDYTAGEYPATLESAVRSGVQAARALL